MGHWSSDIFFFFKHYEPHNGVEQYDHVRFVGCFISRLNLMVAF